MKNIFLILLALPIVLFSCKDDSKESIVEVKAELGSSKLFERITFITAKDELALKVDPAKRNGTSSTGLVDSKSFEKTVDASKKSTFAVTDAKIWKQSDILGLTSNGIKILGHNGSDSHTVIVNNAKDYAKFATPLNIAADKKYTLTISIDPDKAISHQDSAYVIDWNKVTATMVAK